MHFIDLHTHAWPDSASGNIAFHSFHQLEISIFQGYKTACSVGLHPWYLSESTWENQWQWFENAVQQPNVRIIGEIGLDTLRGPSLTFQQRCFEKQLDFAIQQGKPVIIHCVRAFDLLYASILRMNPTIPLILHGVNRKPELLKPFLSLGMGFSFGSALLKPGSPAQATLHIIPKTHYWLETDASGLPIQHIYQHAATLLQVTVEELIQDILENSKRIGIL